MNKVKLGSSSLTVSELCLGTMHFGTKVEKSKSFELLDLFLDGGGDFIDTSNNYAFWIEGGNGDESEKVLGEWLKHVNRDKVVIATKVGAKPQFPGAGLDRLEGLSYSTIIKAIEESLKRLNTDYIDLYYAHVDWPEFPIEERLEAFRRLVKDGKVREIGASNMDTWRFEESIGIAHQNDWPKYCCLQQKYSYLRPRYDADFWVQKLITDEWLRYAIDKNIKLIAYSTLLSGAYSHNRIPKEYESEDGTKRMDALSSLARELNVTPNQLVLKWLIKKNILPLIAASKPSQLEENLAIEKFELTDAQMSFLDQAGT